MEETRLAEGKQMLNRLGITPAYTVTSTNDLNPLTECEHRYLFSHGETTIAFTSVCADVMFRRYLDYQWRGRGCCIVFRMSPLAMTREQNLGVMLHEAGHFVAEYDNPAREEPDVAKAGKLMFQNLKPESEHHNKTWLRAVVHLWSRANSLDYNVPLSCVANLEQYGYSRKDLLPLLNEAERRGKEPIEKILASPYPGTKCPKLTRQA